MKPPPRTRPRKPCCGCGPMRAAMIRRRRSFRPGSPASRQISVWTGCASARRSNGTTATMSPLPAGQEQAIGDRQLAERVNAALRALPERQRLALVLCHYEDLSMAEAASAMETSVEAVESPARRGPAAASGRPLAPEWQSAAAGRHREHDKNGRKDMTRTHAPHPLLAQLEAVLDAHGAKPPAGRRMRARSCLLSSPRTNRRRGCLPKPRRWTGCSASAARRRRRGWRRASCGGGVIAANGRADSGPASELHAPDGQRERSLGAAFRRPPDLAAS